MIAFEEEQLRKDKEKAKKILDEVLAKVLASMVSSTQGPSG